MNINKVILSVLIVAGFAACSPGTQSVTSSVVKNGVEDQVDTSLVTKISIPNSTNLGSPIAMTFTVYNPTDVVKTFCKWHTPFEPLMSKYLDVFSNDGTEADYKGPMAKRAMPPPADSYLTVKPKDSLSVTVDLTKAYELKAGNYTVKYNSESISGLKLADSVRFLIK